MKYIIVAKNIFEGTSTDDSANPLVVTEIATELVITRLYLIMMLQDEKITKDDCVVTIEERKCLYTKIFKNVLSYHEFEKLNVKNLDVIDLLSNEDTFYGLSSGPVELRPIPYKPFYQNWNRDKDLILSVDWSDLVEYDLSSPFLCLVIRKRLAWSEKNMSDEFWDNLVEKLKENNIKTFIFGKESEKWCDDKTIFFVRNYKDWCSIVSNKNCKSIMSTMTGGVYPSLIFGNDSIHMTIIDNTNLIDIHGNDPSFFNECINFSRVKINFINYIPNTDEIYYEITKYL